MTEPLPGSLPNLGPKIGWSTRALGLPVKWDCRARGIRVTTLFRPAQVMEDAPGESHSRPAGQPPGHAVERRDQRAGLHRPARRRLRAGPDAAALFRTRTLRRLVVRRIVP